MQPTGPLPASTGPHDPTTNPADDGPTAPSNVLGAPTAQVPTSRRLKPHQAAIDTKRVFPNDLYFGAATTPDDLVALVSEEFVDLCRLADGGLFSFCRRVRWAPATAQPRKIGDVRMIHGTAILVVVADSVPVLVDLARDTSAPVASTASAPRFVAVPLPGGGAAAATHPMQLTGDDGRDAGTVLALSPSLWISATCLLDGTIVGHGMLNDTPMLLSMTADEPRVVRSMPIPQLAALRPLGAVAAFSDSAAVFAESDGCRFHVIDTDHGRHIRTCVPVKLHKDTRVASIACTHEAPRKVVLVSSTGRVYVGHIDAALAVSAQQVPETSSSV